MKFYLFTWISYIKHLYLFLYSLNLHNQNAFQRTIVICWLCGSFLNLAILFGLYKRYISVLASAIYVAMSRTLWSVGMAWILVACCTNHGGKCKISCHSRLFEFKLLFSSERLHLLFFLQNIINERIVCIFSVQE